MNTAFKMHVTGQQERNLETLPTATEILFWNMERKIYKRQFRIFNRSGVTKSIWLSSINSIHQVKTVPVHRFLQFALLPKKTINHRENFHQGEHPVVEVKYCKIM